MNIRKDCSETIYIQPYRKSKSFQKFEFGFKIK